MEKSQNNKTILNKIMFIVGTVLCVILLPLLIINITMIIKSYTNTEEVPSFGRYIPFIVLTDSMSGEIESGDFIICEKIDAEDVEVGMIISFYDPAGNGSSVVTHKVIAIDTSDGLKFKTQGVANNIADEQLVPAKNIIAEYKFRIPLLGSISYFMSTVPGLIVCVLVPLGLLIGYDVIRRKLNEKNNQIDTAALIAELEALKAEKKSSENKGDEN